MSELVPVILINDDEDDFELILSAYQETGCARPVIWFDKPDEALSFLCQTKETPFMIIADISLPIMDGLELRRLMRETKLQTMTSVPFFFLSTVADTALMRKGYELMVQGFFTKPSEFSALVEIIEYMVQYSSRSAEMRHLAVR